MNCNKTGKPWADDNCESCGFNGDCEAQPPTLSTGFTGSTATPLSVDNNNMNNGVWFKSAITGMFYRNHDAAGDIDLIVVDGVWFERGEHAPILEP